MSVCKLLAKHCVVCSAQQLGALRQVGESAFAELKVASSGALGAQTQTVLWPALGGLATGCIALLYPEVLYQVRCLGIVCLSMSGETALYCTCKCGDTADCWT